MRSQANVFAVAAADLTPDLVGAWLALTESAGDCSSPLLTMASNSSRL